MKNNQTQNPFAIFGTPSKVIINGIKEPEGDIAECLVALQKHASEVLSYIITKIDGIIKLYVATV